MPSWEEFAARVTALEEQMRLAREDAAARVLAGGADRDVAAFGARLDAHKALLEALRQTQVEQGRKIGDLDRKVGELEREMRAGFATRATGQSQIVTFLTRMSEDG